MSKNIIIGIAGGTGSGKTTLAERIIEELNEPNVLIIKQDAYYKSHKELSFEKRKNINFDHPDAFDTQLLMKQLSNLKDDVPVEMPQYDFSTHLRMKQSIPVSPHKVIMLEGILVFENKELRNLLDIKIFVDTDADVRVLRRIKRDVKDRGRTFDSVYNQYMKTVRPMHLEFVEPSKRFADIIVPEGGLNRIAIDMIVSKIKHILQESEEK